MEHPKIECGWKGCRNSFTSVEGMNVHVQADHMVYRVLVQTEYQGRSHVEQAYDPRPTLREMKEEVMEHSAHTTPPQSPLELQTMSHHLMRNQATGPPMVAPQLAPYRQTDVGHRTGALIKVEREEVVMENREEEDEEEDDEEEELPVRQEIRQIVKPHNPLATSGALFLNQNPSSSSRKRSASVNGSGDHKQRNYHSRYWTYTSQMSYRCNVNTCNAEFSTANAARHHYISNHDENNNSPGFQAVRVAVQNAAPKKKRRTLITMNKRRSAGSKRQHCVQPGCGRWFMSIAALENHVDSEHAGQMELNVAEPMVGEPEPEEEQQQVSDAGEEEEDITLQERANGDGDDEEVDDEEEEEELVLHHGEANPSRIFMYN